LRGVERGDMRWMREVEMRMNEVECDVEREDEAGVQ
jgi:hypothetical protein